ncbi:MAG: hypothetical protein U1B30_00130, partial [Pseudomonadota bacterium]|nr:hypothetical protein [Pseudomonadota bacterium]
LPKDITNIPRALLQQKVAQALVRADVRLLQTIWPTLVAREPELLFAALQHYLPQAEIRQQLMMQLPLSIQADIIGILAADIKPLFLRLQQMADELVNAMSTQAGNENNFAFIDSALTNGAEKINSESPTHLQRRLWEIAVGVLLNHSPATVSSPNTKNPDIFLHQLIEHYAHIGSLNAQWLQQLWRQVIQLSASIYTGTIFSSTSTAEKLIPVQNDATQSFSTHSSIESATTSPKAESMLFEASINELSSVEPLAVASSGNDSLISEPNIIQQQFVVQPTSEAHSGNLQTISAAPTHLSATPQPENPLQRTASQQPNLDNISDHQLFDLCLRLKSGAVSWSQILFDVALLQRMIDSYIRLGHSATAENCRDFIAAIDHQAAATPAATEFYRAVLQALVADKLVDLEAIASVVAKSPQTINAGVTDPVPTPAANTTIATDVVRADNSDVQFQLADNQVSAAESTDSGVKLRVSKSAEETAVPTTNPTVTNNAHSLPLEKKEFTPANITAIAESLGADTQPHKQLQQLRLSAAQWQQLCAAIIQHDTAVEINTAENLLKAIHNFANRAIYFDLYYRHVVSALLQQQPLDLELFANTANDNTQNNSLALTASTSTSSATDDLLAATNPLTAATSVYTSRNNNDGDDKDLPNIQSQIDATKTEQLSSEDGSAVTDQLKPHIQHSTMNTYVQSLLAAAQPVEHLQQLHLNNHQWQEICNELILHQAIMNTEATNDLLQSIKTFAQHALNTANYYRKVVHALLQQQAIDLELFASAASNNTQNNSAELTASASTSSATDDRPAATHPLTAAASTYISRNNDSDKYSPKIQSQIDTTKTVPLSNEDRSAVHEQNETKIQQSAIHAYVQSLLTAALPVEHLQQLHLNNDQWQEICSELILHQATMNADAASDLLQSIKNVAQQALNTTSYYRKVVHALLQQQVIDLELFANTSGDNAQTRFNEAANAATTTADLQTTKTQAINIHTTVNDQAAADPNVQSEHNTDEPQKAQQPGMPLTINTNTPLLTGSADSLRKPVISLAQLLSVETTFTREQLLVLQQHINFLLQHATTDIVNEWLELLSEAKHHSQLIRAVPAHLLHQIVMRLQPTSYPPLDALVKVVNEAIALLAADSSSLALKQTKWEFIFHTMFLIRPTTLDKKQLTETLCRIFA